MDNCILGRLDYAGLITFTRIHVCVREVLRTQVRNLSTSSLRARCSRAGVINLREPLEEVMTLLSYRGDNMALVVSVTSRQSFEALKMHKRRMPSFGPIGPETHCKE